MTSKTYYSETIKKNPFKHNLAHEIKQSTPWLLTFSLSALLMFVLPIAMDLISSYYSLKTYAMNNTDPWTLSYSFNIGIMGILIFPAFAFLLALIQFKCLSNRRAMDVYASLPITRSEFFYSKITAGLICLIAPIFTCDLILFVVNVATVGFSFTFLQEVLFVLFLQIVLMLIPYAITVLFSCLTGTVTENVLYPLITYFSPLILFNVILSLCQVALHGFVDFESDALVSNFLCPHYGFLMDIPDTINGKNLYATLLFNITENLPNLKAQLGVDVSLFDVIRVPLLVASTWLILMAVCILLAGRVYKNRNMENAGRKGVCTSIHTVLCFISSFVAGLIVAVVFGFFSSGLSYIMFFLGSLLGFVIYQAVILQNIKLILKSLLKYACFSVFFVAFIIAMNTNLFGYYTRTHEPENISSVTVENLYGLHLNSTLLQFNDYELEHLSSSPIVLADDEAIKSAVSYFNKSNENPYSSGIGNGIKIRLTTTSGGRVTRQFDVTQENAPYFYEILTHLNIIDCTEVLNYDTLSSATQITFSDIFKTNEHTLTEEEKLQFDIEAFQSALKQDMLDEGLYNMPSNDKPQIGIVTFHGYRYVEDYAYGEYDDKYEDTVIYDGEITYDKDIPQTPDDIDTFINVPIKSTFKNTIAYLDSLGYTDYFKISKDKITSVQTVDISKTDYWYYSYLTYSEITNSIGLSLTEERSASDNFTAIDVFESFYEYHYDKNVYPITDIDINDKESLNTVLDNCYLENTITDTSKLVLVQTEQNASIFIASFN